VYRILETSLLTNKVTELDYSFATDQAAVDYICNTAWRPHVTESEAERMVLKEEEGKGSQFVLCLKRGRIIRWDVIHPSVERMSSGKPGIVV